MVVAALDPEHSTLVMSVFCVFFVVWLQYLIRKAWDAVDLRTAVQTQAVIRMDQLGRIPIEFSVRAFPGRLSALGVFHSKAVFVWRFCPFVWARGALNGPKRRFSAPGSCSTAATSSSSCASSARRGRSQSRPGKCPSGLSRARCGWRWAAG